MDYFFYLLIILILGISGCGYTKNSQSINNSITVKVDVSSDEDSPLSNFIKSERKIILETNDSCLINKIQHFFVKEDTVTIQSGPEVFTFDPNGKWLSYLNRQGQGPEEYLNIDAIRVRNGLIYILDSHGKKIMTFNPDGEFLRSVKLDDKYIDFYIPDDNHFILASGNSNLSMYNFIWIDSFSGEILSKFAPYGISQSVLYHDYIPFSGILADTLIVNTPFCLTNYRLSQNSLEALGTFIFNTSQQLPEYDPMELDINEVGRTTTFFMGVKQLGYVGQSQNSKYILFNLFGSRGGIMPNLVKFNKDWEQESRTLLGFRIMKDFPYLCPSGEEIIYLANDKLYMSRFADNLINADNLIETNYWESQGLTEDSNPVIFIYTLK